MRKRTIEKLFDKIWWGIIILLPILTYFAITTFSQGAQQIDFFEWLQGSQFMHITNGVNNIFGDIISQIFQTMGFGYDDGFICMISWFGLVELTQVLYDVAVFIPRVIHSILHKAQRGID